MQARLLRRVCSMQESLLNAGASAQCRRVYSMQARLLNAGASARCRRVCSMQARLLRRVCSGASAQARLLWPVCSMQARLLNAGPSTQRKPVYSTQARLLNASPSTQCKPVCPSKLNTMSMRAPVAPRGVVHVVALEWSASMDLGTRVSSDQDSQAPGERGVALVNTSSAFAYCALELVCVDATSANPLGGTDVGAWVRCWLQGPPPGAPA